MRLSFLNNDSAFGRICTFIGTIVMVNLMFVLTVIPLVTAGAGFCAMYYSMLKLIRYKEINPFSEFFHGFRDNFKKATLSWIGILGLAFFFYADLRICSYMTGILKNCVFVIWIGIVALIFISMYLFPVMASFEGNIRRCIKNSVFFIGSNLLYMILIGFLNIVPMVLTYANLAILPLSAFIWCLCGFALIAFINSMFLMRLFEKYLDPLDEHDEKNNEKKILEEMRKLEGGS
ncbi:MAG: YesL family protein [Ruminococcus sp.]|jgi:uncharacterized membrane protein YesL